jgi:hypothetical protein
MASKLFFKPFVTLPAAPIITGIITHFMFHIRCISIHKLLYSTVYKTPTKCTSLYHFFISLDPYICFRLCKNHHQGVFKTTYIYIQWYFCPYCYAIS